MLHEQLTFRCRRKLLVECKPPEIFLLTQLQQSAITFSFSILQILKNVPSKMQGVFDFSAILLNKRKQQHSIEYITYIIYMSVVNKLEMFQTVM